MKIEKKLTEIDEDWWACWIEIFIW